MLTRTTPTGIQYQLIQKKYITEGLGLMGFYAATVLPYILLALCLLG